jgi:integrase
VPRALRGETYKLETKGPDGRPLWGYRLHRGKGGRKGGFRTQSEAKEALEAARDALLSQRTGIARAGLRDVTVDKLGEMYLESHTASERTLENYAAWLAAARKPVAEGGLGDMKVVDVAALDVAAWRKRQPERSAHYYHKALSQELAFGVKIAKVPGLMRNVAADVDNPRPKRREIAYFETWADVERVDDELVEWARGLVVVGSGTGMMPEEWIALRVRDVSIPFAAITIARAYSEGRLSEYGKTDGRRRRIPLRAKVLDVLKARVDGKDPDDLVFPGLGGSFIPLRSFRTHFWDTAVESAGLEGRTPYAMRHTYAAFSLAAHVNIYTLARRMGTSVAMIDKTYGHLAPDADEYERDLLDAFDAKQDVERTAADA